MATTAQNIFDRAIQRSALNNPDLVPNAQVLQYITLFERGVYMRGAQLNPDYFGKDANSATRADNAASWDMATTPGDVAALTRAEVATIVGSVSGVAVGDRVRLIGLRWPEVDVSPRAYVRGRKITQYSTELGTSGTNFVSVLKLFYSPVPAAVTALTQSLTLADEWTQLVELPLARLLAIRDGRLPELQGIDAEYGMVLQSFDEAATAFDHGVRRPLVAVRANQIPVGRPAAQ